MTLKAQVTNEKKNKLDIIKTLNFCASKDPIKKMMATYRMRGNIYKSYVS